MKAPDQTNPPRGEKQAAPQRKPFPAQKAAVFLASFLSGCGAAPQQAGYVETNGHAEMVIVSPGGPSQSLRERFAPMLENADHYRVYPDGREGTFGSISGGWSFRVLESESSERAGLYLYELLSNRDVMGLGEAEPVTRMVVTRSRNPNFNVPLQPSEYTAVVGSDVFIFAIPSMVIFNFFNPLTEQHEMRFVKFDETGQLSIPEGSIIGVSYNPEEKKITVFYFSEEKMVLVELDLRTTDVSAREVS